MKKYIYACERGGIKLGNETFNIDLINGRGDGCFPIYVGSEKEMKRLRPKDSVFIGSIEGKFNVYECDIGDDFILCELEGCYGISDNRGTIYLVRWELE